MLACLAVFFSNTQVIKGYRGIQEEIINFAISIQIFYMINLSILVLVSHLTKYTKCKAKLKTELQLVPFFEIYSSCRLVLYKD